MDPWLERHWGDIHGSIIPYCRDLIADGLPPTLFARVEETVYLIESGEDVGRFQPDYSVFDTTYRDGGDLQGAEGTLAVAEPVRLRVSDETVTLGHIEIRRLEGDEPLVTAIEIISPTNKLDPRNRRQYVNKRQAYYQAGVNVVEIDLLRAGEPLIDVPWKRLRPELLTPYRACIRRVPRPDADTEIEYYPLRLQHRLPRLRIPLRPQDPDVVLDLQQPINLAYEKGRYGLTLKYNDPAPPPPLSDADAAWVADVLRHRRA